MIRYLCRRAGHGLLMLFGVSILLFLLFQAAPGDFLSDARVNSQISAETLAQLRVQYGLDQPLPVRYWQWLKSSARGEFGYSFAYNTPASTLLLAARAQYLAAEHSGAADFMADRRAAWACWRRDGKGAGLTGFFPAELLRCLRCPTCSLLCWLC